MNHGFDDQENAAGRGKLVNDDAVEKLQVSLPQVPIDAVETDPLEKGDEPSSTCNSKSAFIFPKTKAVDNATTGAMTQIAKPDDIGFLDSVHERCDSGSSIAVMRHGEDGSLRDEVTSAELKVLEDVAGVSFLLKPVFTDDKVAIPTKHSTSDASPIMDDLGASSTIAGLPFRSLHASQPEQQIHHQEEATYLCKSSPSTKRSSPTIEELNELMDKAGVTFVSTQASLGSETALLKRKVNNQKQDAKCQLNRLTHDEKQHEETYSDCDDEDFSGMADANLEDLIKIMTGETLDIIEREGSLSGSCSLATTLRSRVTDNILSVNNTQGSELMESNHLVHEHCNNTHSRSEFGLQNNKRLLFQRRMSEELELEDKTHSPNRPHPALEYPPLYFILRRLPWLFERIKAPYALRWRVIYPLQKNVPFSVAMRKVGVYLTWGELLLLIPFFAAILAGMVYTIVFPSVAVTGKVARFAVIAGLVFAQRNSLFTLLVGVPFDRAIFYHKLAGLVAGITSLLHTVAFFLDPGFRKAHNHAMLAGAFTGQVNISGSVFMLLIVAITATSLPPVRRRCFEFFYILHMLFTAGMVSCAFFHTGKLVPILALLTWGTDHFIRSIVMARTRYPRKAFLKKISETVVEISFPKTAAFSYNPGQYIYIAIPEISWLQWHPFSISSSPKQRVVTLHVRKAGNWTSAMFDLVEKKQEVSILIEGPYGNLSVDIFGDKYQSIMLLSGGIGITPMQSICDQLLYEKSKDRRRLNHLKFIWIERDPILMQEAEFVRRTSSIGSIEIEDYLSASGSINFEASDQVVETSQHIDRDALNQQLAQMLAQDHSIDLASQLLSAVAPGRTTDEEFDKLYESDVLSVDSSVLDAISLDNGLIDGDQVRSDPPKRRRSSFSFLIDDETSFAENSSPWLAEAPPIVESLVKVLDMQVYLTGPTSENGEVPFARHGRPNIKRIFKDMKRIAVGAGDNRVAVCVCAPKKLTELCRKACLKYSDDDVTFDFHTECLET